MKTATSQKQEKFSLPGSPLTWGFDDRLALRFLGTRKGLRYVKAKYTILRSAAGTFGALVGDPRVKIACGVLAWISKRNLKRLEKTPESSASWGAKTHTILDKAGALAATHLHRRVGSVYAAAPA